MIYTNRSQPYRVMSEVLCIVCLLERLNLWQTTVNRIGLKPYGMPGEVADDSSRLVNLRFIRTALCSPFVSQLGLAAPAVPSFTIAPRRRLSRTMQKWLSPLVLLFIHPSAVRSLRTTKKKSRITGKLIWLFVGREVSRLCDIFSTSSPVMQWQKYSADLSHAIGLNCDMLTNANIKIRLRTHA